MDYVRILPRYLILGMYAVLIRRADESMICVHPTYTSSQGLCVINQLRWDLITPRSEIHTHTSYIHTMILFNTFAGFTKADLLLFVVASEAASSRNEPWITYQYMYIDTAVNGSYVCV